MDRVNRVIGMAAEANRMEALNERLSEDIRLVALSKGQRRITMITEKDDGSKYVRVIIEEVDRDAGMASTGMRTVREETFHA